MPAEQLESLISIIYLPDKKSPEAFKLVMHWYYFSILACNITYN